MPRHPELAPGDSPDREPDATATAEADGTAGRGGRAAAPSLAGLGIAGISRRRLAWGGVVVAAAWIVLGFAGQAAEASRAASDLAAEEARTAAAAADTTALQRELALVTEQRWILQQARAYQLGSRRERPFALAPDAPPLPADAPGSATRRLGAEVAPPSPLESWLDVLFGPGG